MRTLARTYGGAHTRVRTHTHSHSKSACTHSLADARCTHPYRHTTARSHACTHSFVTLFFGLEGPQNVQFNFEFLVEYNNFFIFRHFIPSITLTMVKESRKYMKTCQAISDMHAMMCTMSNMFDICECRGSMRNNV